MENINVFIRAKPYDDISQNQNSIFFNLDENSVTNLKTSENFTFSRVFSQNENTLDIHNRYFQNQLSSLFRGINLSIFAYGQTSSGKTFTMQGNQLNPGIIPLSIEEIFRIKSKANDKIEIKISYMEIYNESLNDLLDPRKRNLEIRESREKGIFVENITEVLVENVNQAMNLLIQGDNNKIIGETKLNENSSRSHTIFRLNIQTIEMSSEKNIKITYFSQLNLIDLAGSENAAQNNNKIRLKEGSNINKSLLSLSIVINKLSTPDSGFINYRDSKLTRLLQTALSGNSKTFIICNISMNPNYYQETMNTINFGLKAKNIKTHIKPNEIMDEKTKILNENNTLKNKIRDLEEEIMKKEEILKSNNNFRSEEFSIFEDKMNISQDYSVIAALEKEVAIIKQYLVSTADLKKEQDIRDQGSALTGKANLDNNVDLLRAEPKINPMIFESSVKKINFDENIEKSTVKSNKNNILQYCYSNSQIKNLNSNIKLDKYQSLLNDSEANYKKLEKEYESLKKQNKEKEEELKNLIKKQNQLEEELRVAKEEIDICGGIEEIEKLKINNFDLHSKIIEISEKYGTISEQYNQEKVKLREFELLHNKLQQENKEFRLKIEEINLENTKLKQEREKYETENEKYQIENNNKDDYSKIKIENIKLKTDNINLAKKVEEYQKLSKISKYTELEKIISDKTITLHGLESDINNLKFKIVSLESQNEILVRENSKVNKENSITIRDLKKQIYLLEKKNIYLEKLDKRGKLKENTIQNNKQASNLKNKQKLEILKTTPSEQAHSISEFLLLSGEKEPEFTKKKRGKLND